MILSKKRDLQVYLTRDGFSPYEEWLREFKSQVVRARIISRVYRAAEGNFGKFRHLGEIFELKENFGPGYRIYFGIVRDEIILLLLGGDKSDQDGDIERAKIYFRDYQKRKIRNG